MTDAFDELEVRDPEEREQVLFARLPLFIADAVKACPGWARRLEGTDPKSVTSRASLAALPVLSKQDLKASQQQEPPLGGFAAHGESFGRLFMSPGPIYEPMGRSGDTWRMARALHAAGFRKGDVVHNAFAYHLTPGGFMLDWAARSLGCVVIPGGVGNTEMQVEAIAHLRPQGYTGTPDFLKILMDKASELGRDVSSIQKAVVSGGAL